MILRTDGMVGTKNNFVCDCGKSYSHSPSLYNHKRYECGKTAQFSCEHCNYLTCRKGNLKRHLFLKHSIIE